MQACNATKYFSLAAEKLYYICVNEKINYEHRPILGLMWTEVDELQ